MGEKQKETRPKQQQQKNPTKQKTEKKPQTKQPPSKKMAPKPENLMNQKITATKKKTPEKFPRKILP